MKHELSGYRGNRDLFDEAFDAFFKPTFFNMDSGAMKTDIRDDGKNYVLEIEMPGYRKEDIAINLEDGYVSVSARKNESVEDKSGKQYLRRERSVSCSRSYYVGEVNEKDVKAKFDNGILTLTFPKQPEKLSSGHNIGIE